MGNNFQIILADKGNKSIMAKTKYPITKYERGNLVYIEFSTGDWCKREYDTNGNETYYEDSSGEKRGTSKAEQGQEVVIKTSEIIKNKLTDPDFISKVSLYVSLFSMSFVLILGFLTYLLSETM